MNHWLLKTEPGTFSWNDLLRDKKAVWDGVRNFQARKHLKGMKKGDTAFIYHTGDEKAVIGIATVVKESYPEPKDPDWVAVDLAPLKPLSHPVTLSRIRQTKSLQKMVLVKAARLSVQPVTDEEFSKVIELSNTP
jgi:predicted RNA-binding protein with PUA-like domain